MYRLRILSLIALAGRLIWAGGAADERDKIARPAAPTSVPASRTTPSIQLPKVMQGTEPADNRVVMLPGAETPRRAKLAAPVAPPVTHPSPLRIPPGWHPTGVPSLPPAPEMALARPSEVSPFLQAVVSNVTLAPRPVIVVPTPAPDTASTSAAGRAKLAFPSMFAQESAVFCQREIGHWTLAEARELLGEPHRQRPATDDDSSENGHIFAFHDPTNRYKELELDFDKKSGVLRSVFVYPWNLTWTECRKLWGGNVSATEGNRGRVFYSYVNRHLDVLVDRDGKVISLGLY
jgi:hypothetical protein